MDEIGLIHVKKCYFGQKGIKDPWPLNFIDDLFAPSLSIGKSLKK